MARQLALGFARPEGASLETFIAGPNSQAIAGLSALAKGCGESFIYLWGNRTSGKSHLLQAACLLAEQAQQTAVFIPLKQAMEFTPEILDNLENSALVCLDDVQAIAGEIAWEQALFHLFNRLMDRGNRLLVAADSSPKRLPLELPDLASRLAWGLCYQLHGLQEKDQRQALIEDAARRGLEMSKESARYILRHTPRDMGSLRRLLVRLDHSSLEAKRRLTIPFIKQCLRRQER